MHTSLSELLSTPVIPYQEWSHKSYNPYWVIRADNESLRLLGANLYYGNHCYVHPVEILRKLEQFMRPPAPSYYIDYTNNTGPGSSSAIDSHHAIRATRLALNYSVARGQYNYRDYPLFVAVYKRIRYTPYPPGFISIYSSSAIHESEYYNRPSEEFIFLLCFDLEHFWYKNTRTELCIALLDAGIDLHTQWLDPFHAEYGNLITSICY